MNPRRPFTPGLGSLAVRLVLGGLLIRGGVAKMGSHDWWRDLVGRMELLPDSLVGPLSGMLPGIELVVGSALVLGLLGRSAAMLTALLHLLFGAVMLALILRDAPATCGCFGPGSEYPVDWMHLVTNVAQFLAALLLLVLRPGALTLDSLLTRSR